MRIGRALSRGIGFGAQLGMVAALIGCITLGFGGLGLSEAFFNAPVYNTPVGAIGEVFAGLLGGAAIGGALFTATHVLVHSIPGMARLLGEAPEKYHTQSRQRSRGIGIGKAAPSNDRFIEESDDRNTGFRRQLEEQRQREELYDMYR